MVEFRVGHVTTIASNTHQDDNNCLTPPSLLQILHILNQILSPWWSLIFFLSQTKKKKKTGLKQPVRFSFNFCTWNGENWTKIQVRFGVWFRPKTKLNCPKLAHTSLFFFNKKNYERQFTHHTYFMGVEFKISPETNLVSNHCTNHIGTPAFTSYYI